MKIFSEEQKQALQDDLTAMLAKYDMPYGYVVCCSVDGFALTVEANRNTVQLQFLAKSTHQALLLMHGTNQAPRINDN